MKILVCNDDGVHAAGLRSLCTSLISKGYEVYVCAPDKERSASGHALTLHRPLRVDILDKDFFPGAKAIYAIDGFPADCVKIAINKILDFKPDWVISGINHGPNMGSDVLYSGTVSAAMEGAIYGVKSVAISVSEYKTTDFDEEAYHVPKLLEKLGSKEFKWPSKTIFNINLPVLPKEEVTGMALTTLGSRMYKDTYEERMDPRSRFYYWLSGDLLTSDNDPESDVSRAAEGCISITPVTFEMTNYELIVEMRHLF
ncbi:MAG: 5'/3'-nucleotidase SurE [Candidatus Caenarcaniphilales bacterium]|nr:5'/3'-nucleotidase SurE [Candidatus Caenarcaniphilales bacterium]